LALGVDYSLGAELGAKMKHANSIRALAFVLAVLLFEGWVASDRALATCGDYVVVGGGGVVGGGHARMIQTGTIKTGVIESGTTNPPCQGPNCSRRSAPLETPPVTVPPHSQDWILPTVAWCDLSVKPLDVVHFESHRHAHLRASVVFRPPRSL